MIQTRKKKMLIKVKPVEGNRWLSFAVNVNGFQLLKFFSLSLVSKAVFFIFHKYS